MALPGDPVNKPWVCLPRSYPGGFHCFLPPLWTCNLYIFSPYLTYCFCPSSKMLYLCFIFKNKYIFILENSIQSPSTGISVAFSKAMYEDSLYPQDYVIQLLCFCLRGKLYHFGLIWISLTMNEVSNFSMFISHFNLIFCKLSIYIYAHFLLDCRIFLNWVSRIFFMI